MRKSEIIILCACGCGGTLKLYDEHYRRRKYINGHNGRKYKDPKQYKREWNHKNKEQRRNYKDLYILKFKQELIESKGNKCKNCDIKHNGYNTSIFDFHHIPSYQKEFGVNKTSINRYSKEKLIEEAKKCDLLCANCHRLLHWSSEIQNTYHIDTDNIITRVIFDPMDWESCIDPDEPLAVIKG